MYRMKRKIFFLFGAGSLFFSIQTAFQTISLMPEVPITLAVQTRNNHGGKPLNGKVLENYSDNLNTIQYDGAPPKHRNVAEKVPTRRFNDEINMEGETDLKLHSARTPKIVYNFKQRIRAAEFNVDISRPNIGSATGMNPCAIVAKHATFLTVNSTKHEVPFWQRKLKQCGRLGHVSDNGVRGYFLAEMLQVRIYQNDLANWSINELKQWIHFMFLAGVDHIFLCDNHRSESERLDIHLEKYINLGLISYFNWNRSGDAVGSQIDCYEHVIGRNAFKTMWTMAVDMDEYPVSFSDTQEGFLMRYLAKSMELFGPDLTEISIPNFLMLGEGDKTKDLVSSRINRMTLEEYGKFVKPIFRPKRVVAGLHNNNILFGSHAEADSDKLRTLHYWGKRLQDWGPDTEKVLNMTRETDFMLTHWDERIRSSLLVFGEEDAFSRRSGP